MKAIRFQTIKSEKRLREMSEVNKNSMLYWFPKIKDLGIPIPRTFFVVVKENLLECLDDPAKFPKSLLETIEAVAKTVTFNFKRPLFLRTDQLSGKHYWEKTCYVEKAEDLFAHIFQLIEESASADILGKPIQAFVLREFIELDWKFKAFEGMPVARERRYFIKGGQVICHHPYWVEKAIKFWQKNYTPPKNWRQLLKELNTETSEEISILTEYSKKVATIMKGFWSVDFAMGKDGTWYLIDMALGADSWHPSDCPNCPEKLRKQMQIYEGEG
jgi:hypothetical protein